MPTISLCMIVKNEEDQLADCLSSAKDIVDEIIIADTGSTDNTKNIALQYTPHVYDFTWADDFSKARNFAFSHATMDYILWLDADDIILNEDRDKFIKLKNTLPSHIGTVMMLYNIAFDDDGKPTFTYYRERLTKRSLNAKWHEPVHEFLECLGTIIETDISITHAKKHHTSSMRNIYIYESIINSGGSLSPRGMYYYARELKDHGRYNDAIEWFNTFLSTDSCWVEDAIASCIALGHCYTQLNDNKNALHSLYRSFDYDHPRAEPCCHIGYCFKAMKSFKLALYWFDTALKLPPPSSKWGFTNPQCEGYIPALECAVCSDKLGDVEKAKAYNELAGEFNPSSEQVRQNREYFEALTEHRAR